MSVSSRLSALRSGLSVDFGVNEIEGIVVGGLFGALQVGFIMGFYNIAMTKKIGAIVGTPTIHIFSRTLHWDMHSLTGGWWMTMILGVLFGIPFVVFVSGSINSFANSVIMLSSRISLLQKMLVPLLKRSALGITCGGVGILYGIIVGIVFQVIFLPIWLEAVMDIAVPLTIGWVVAGIAAWTLYGGAMGLVYGLILENSTG